MQLPFGGRTRHRRSPPNGKTKRQNGKTVNKYTSAKGTRGMGDRLQSGKRHPAEPHRIFLRQVRIVATTELGLQNLKQLNGAHWSPPSTGGNGGLSE